MYTDAIQMKIDTLKHAYEIELKYFLLDVQNEQSTTNYEKNLINKLIGMQQLKSEIKSLEQVIDMRIDETKEGDYMDTSTAKKTCLCGSCIQGLESHGIKIYVGSYIEAKCNDCGDTEDVYECIEEIE